MMKTFSICGYTLLMVVLSASFVSAETPAKNTPRVCILSENTELKNKMIESIEQDLKPQGVIIIKDSISNATLHNPTNYSAVIILTAVYKFSAMPLTEEYVITNNYAKNIVYLATYAGINFPYGKMDKQKIDAITMASDLKKTKEFEKARNEIVSRVQKIILQKEVVK